MFFVFSAQAQTLDFNSIEVSVIESSKTYPEYAILIAIFMLVITFLIAWLATKRKGIKKSTFKLNSLPSAARLIPTIFLVTFFFVHIIALTDAMVQSKVIAKSAYEYFHFMKYSRLLGLSHSHIFGHTVMYTLVAIPFAFTRWSEFIKALLITGAMISAFFDVGSWWLIKYFGEEFEIISMVSGMTFSGCFIIMAGKILQELWKH